VRSSRPQRDEDHRQQGYVRTIFGLGNCPDQLRPTVVPTCVPKPRVHGPPSGFTLIEILVVIVVIAILATLVAPNVFQHVGSARVSTARSQIEMLGAALDAYRLDGGAYPTTEQGLNALAIAPTSGDAPIAWRGPYLRKAVPSDPWGHAYIYKSPGDANPNGYDLVSYGADGRPGGADEKADIVSWR
jgi:general secretion pathway protein G